MNTRLLILAKKDARNAQLDLLLRSVARFWPDAYPVVISEPAGPAFNERVHWEITREQPLVCFATDDGFFFRDVPETYPHGSFLCYSLRLGDNTSVCYPTGQTQQVPPGLLVSFRQSEGDFSYPGSVDAHVFRSNVLCDLIGDDYLDNPTALECVLNAACQEYGDRISGAMLRSRLSCYVSNPVNRVSEQSGVRFGQHHPHSADDLETIFQQGRRLDLDAMADMACRRVRGAHWELPFVWESDRAAA